MGPSSLMASDANVLEVSAQEVSLQEVSLQEVSVLPSTSSGPPGPPGCAGPDTWLASTLSSSLP